jgi:predicted nuclease with TOPRIM domain
MLSLDDRIVDLKEALHTLVMLFGEVKRDFEQLIKRRNDLMARYEEIRTENQKLKKENQKLRKENQVLEMML